MPEHTDNPRPMKGYTPQGPPKRRAKPNPNAMTTEELLAMTEALKRVLVLMPEHLDRIHRSKQYLEIHDSYVDYIEQEFGLIARRAFMMLVEPQAVASLSEPLAAAEVTIADEIARLTYGHEVRMLEFVDAALEAGTLQGQAIEAKVLDVRRRRSLAKAGKPIVGSAPGERQKSRPARPTKSRKQRDAEWDRSTRQMEAARRLGLSAFEITGMSAEERAALLGD